MGAISSKPDKALTSLPDEERFFGLENFGNTCYCNSVIQALYYCKPFRSAILKYQTFPEKDYEDDILYSLADLFAQINQNRKKSGVISPKRFVNRLKAENQQFNCHMHQDAHEFLNFLLHQISEHIDRNTKSEKHNVRQFQAISSKLENIPETSVIENETPLRDIKRKNWIEETFQGKLVHQTKCMICETVTSMEEVFFDLHLPIEHNCSLTSCLRKYSSKQMLNKDDKYFCDICCCHQEAFRQNKIKELPKILICHLMRFDGSMRKLMHRVVFPMEMKLCNTSEDASNADDVYNLFAIVVHSGNSLNHGHYYSLVKSHDQWILFDDDQFEPVSEAFIERTFGHSKLYTKNTDRCYILLYEKSQYRPPLQTESSKKLEPVQNKRLLTKEDENEFPESLDATKTHTKSEMSTNIKASQMRKSELSNQASVMSNRNHHHHHHHGIRKKGISKLRQDNQNQTRLEIITNKTNSKSNKLLGISNIKNLIYPTSTKIHTTITALDDNHLIDEENFRQEGDKEYNININNNYDDSAEDQAQQHVQQQWQMSDAIFMQDKSTN